MAESKRDYYEVLGVSKDADEATLKKAYRQVAKKYHPDMNPGDAEAEKKFKEASEAYAVLSDPEKRRQYDQFGHAAFEGGAGGAGGFGGGVQYQRKTGMYKQSDPFHHTLDKSQEKFPALHLYHGRSYIHPLILNQFLSHSQMLPLQM